MIELEENQQVSSTTIQEYQLICKKHKSSDIVQVALIENADPQDRLLCAKCLAGQKQINSIGMDYAKEQIQVSQDHIDNETNNLCKKYLDKVERFKKSIDELIDCLNKKLEEIIIQTDIWKQELGQIEKDSYQLDFFVGIENIVKKNLKNLEADQIDLTYEKLKKCNYAHYNKISRMVETVQSSQQFNHCIDALESAVEKKKTKQEKARNIKVDQEESHDTPSLKVNCPEHGKIIIALNINQGVPQQNRLACIDCDIRDTIKVKEFEQQWTLYEENKKSKQLKIQKISSQSIDEISQQLRELKTELTKSIDELQEQFEKLLFQVRLRLFDSITCENQTVLYQKMAQELSDSKSKRRIIYEIDFFEKNTIMSIALTDKLKEIVKHLKHHSQKIRSIIEKQISVIIHPISYDLVYEQSQENEVYSIAFDSKGQIMLANKNNNVIIYNFANGKFQKQKQLQGHEGTILCILHCKLSNNFITSAFDGTIKCWQQSKSDDWASFQSDESLKYPIVNLTINRSEDTLVSSAFNEIQVWSTDFKAHKILLKQRLEKHRGQILCLSLNLSGNSLITSGKDKLLILWNKQIKQIDQIFSRPSKMEQEESNKEWNVFNIFQTNNIGLRICFLGEDLFAWSQQNIGLISIFKIKENQIIKSDLCIQLDQFLDSSSIFPMIYNQQKETLILKHSKKIYIIGKKINGQFQLESKPIECDDEFICGALTDDGNYLVIWSMKKQSFNVYKMDY